MFSENHCSFNCSREIIIFVLIKVVVIYTNKKNIDILLKRSLYELICGSKKRFPNEDSC